MRGRSLDEARAKIAGSFDGAELERQAAHRVFAGNRPSTTLIYPALDPATLGRIVALYEHRVFVEGVILGINSYDQWGAGQGTGHRAWPGRHRRGECGGQGRLDPRAGGVCAEGPDSQSGLRGMAPSGLRADMGGLARSKGAQHRRASPGRPPARRFAAARATLEYRLWLAAIKRVVRNSDRRTAARRRTARHKVVGGSLQGGRSHFGDTQSGYVQSKAAHLATGLQSDSPRGTLRGNDK